MDIRSLLCAAGVVFMALGADHVQERRREFYAKHVVDHVNINDPESALGKPDGRFAEIKPGGEMTMLMEEALIFLEGSDDGFVVVRGDGAYALAGLFRMSEEGSPAWQPLTPGSAPGRFKLGAFRFHTMQSTETLRIVNNDSRPVYLDAVVGIGMER